MDDKGFYIGRHSQHTLGDLYYAYMIDDAVPGAVEQFERLVAYIKDDRPHLIAHDEDDQISWTFRNNSDGPFWLKMFFQAVIEDDAMRVYESDDYDCFDEDEHNQWYIGYCVEQAELDEDEAHASILRVPVNTITDRAPLWVPHRASRRFTEKAKSRKFR